MKFNLTILLAGVVIVLIAVIAYFGFINKSLFTKTGPVAVNGSFNVNGVIPAGATLTLTEKVLNSNASPTTFAESLPVADAGSWSFPDAASGTTYEIQALVMVNGKSVSQSSPIQVTAPAQNEVLVLNIESDTAGAEPAVLSGYVEVNGYIPANATIQVQGRKVGEVDYTTVASGLPGKTKQFMSYTTAVAGTTYEVIGQLFDASGNQIGTSVNLAVTAPANDEVLTINSKAQPPVTPTPAANTPTPTVVATTLSGSINFNGAAPSNSRIVVFQRVSGQQNFQVAVDNITPADGSTWQWNRANNATWYDVVAVLKQHQSDGTDQDIARSNTVTVAAPANNMQLTINSGMSLPSPTGSITVTCNNQSAGAWNATVNFQSVSGADSYWYQIGTSNGGSDRLNQTQNSNGNPIQTVNPSFQNGVTYWARYAYANVPNVPAGSNQYSGFSGTTSLICQ